MNVIFEIRPLAVTIGEKIHETWNILGLDKNTTIEGTNEANVSKTDMVVSAVEIFLYIFSALNVAFTLLFSFYVKSKAQATFRAEKNVLKFPNCSDFTIFHC